MVCKVLQYMEMYGKKESVNWHDRVIGYVWRMLNIHNETKEERLIVHCLQHRVVEVLSNSTLRRDTRIAVVDGWLLAATHKYKHCNGYRDMHELATYTFECINSCIEGHLVPLTPNSSGCVSSAPTCVSP